MKNKNDYDYFRDFFDLIPDPLVIVNKKSFEIYYVNQEFQNFVKKSFSVIKNTYNNGQARETKIVYNYTPWR